MRPSRPYLIRALYEWIVDNDKTPYILVDATIAGTYVPQEHVNQGNIVLNIDPEAVQQLKLGPRNITFSARFARGHMDCIVPIESVCAIYASENGKGMFFNEEDLGDGFPPEASDETTGDTGSSSGEKRAHLTLVKS